MNPHRCESCKLITWAYTDGKLKPCNCGGELGSVIEWVVVEWVEYPVVPLQPAAAEPTGQPRAIEHDGGTLVLEDVWIHGYDGGGGSIVVTGANADLRGLVKFTNMPIAITATDTSITYERVIHDPCEYGEATHETPPEARGDEPGDGC